MSKLKLPKAKTKQELFNRRVWIKHRLILALILGTIAFGISCLVFVKVEPVIYLIGHLKYQEKVTKLEFPQNSIIHEVYVRSGQQVKKGQPLLSFYIINFLTKLKNLENEQKILIEKNQFYQNLLNQSVDSNQVEEVISQLNISPDHLLVIRKLISLIEENRDLKVKIKKIKIDISSKIENLKNNNQENNSQNFLEEIRSEQKQIILTQKKLISQEDKIAECENKINQIIRENQKEIERITNQNKKLKEKIKPEFFESPISGQVVKLDFNSPEQLEINPKQELVAEVYIPYKGRKYIYNFMEVEIIVNELEKNNKFLGQIISIGSDILPPNKVYPFYRFPVEISLSKTDTPNQDYKNVLKSSMAVTIKIPSHQKLTFLQMIYRKIVLRLD